MKTIGIDASMRKTGIAVLDHKKAAIFRTVKLARKHGRDGLIELAWAASGELVRHEPDLVVVEFPPLILAGRRPQPQVAFAAGCWAMACKGRGLKVVTRQPAEWRDVVLGTCGGLKSAELKAKAMWRAELEMQRLTGRKPANHDEAEALCLAIMGGIILRGLG